MISVPRGSGMSAASGAWSCGGSLRAFRASGASETPTEVFSDPTRFLETSTCPFILTFEGGAAGSFSSSLSSFAATGRQTEVRQRQEASIQISSVAPVSARTLCLLKLLQQAGQIRSLNP